MDDLLRISVRELVAFSYFEPDILPAAGMDVLWAGTQAHKARQSEADGQAEQSIKHSFIADGTEILVYGRMDLLKDGDVPLIEEIKLAAQPPEAPLPEHRAQAVCYASMLSQSRPCEQVSICICYVDDSGAVVRRFEETLSESELCSEMDLLLRPYVRFVQRELKHRDRRDASLRSLAFPFPDYRKGQRELAVQVYTAISRKKRLFASLPTGTGKSAAVLFPSLKALGEGKTGRLVYLTARNTARQSPIAALKRMQEQGMQARCCVLTAKEKLCPNPTRCHPDNCPRAAGHYVRQSAAIDQLLDSGCFLWDETVIRSLADQHELCPFELALALCEIADVLMMDLNHAFDPFAQVKRIFQRQKDFTLLVDEAHHTLERVRESLSGELDSHTLALTRTETGKMLGRKHPLYKALGLLIRALRNMECAVPSGRLSAVPPAIPELVQQLLDVLIETFRRDGVNLTDLLRMCLSFQYACEHLDDDYAVLLDAHGKERSLLLYCLLPGKEIARTTKSLRGTVFFSATLSPLNAMKQLLGGTDEDACFMLPSPFPPERLAVVRRRIATRYEQRDETAGTIARAIVEMLQSHPGNTIVFFPSYAYLDLVLMQLPCDQLPALWIQQREMTEADRERFLDAFQSETPVLALCVLGGLFSEGIDLPGEQLTNVAVVGVGLPVPSARTTALRTCYQERFGDGFAYACRFPGMQKVLQAAGRVIRSETDSGMVLLMDDRYYAPEYEALLPPEWRIYDESLAKAAKQLEEYR